MIRYLSGSAGPELDRSAVQLGIGIMIQPGNNYHVRIERYPAWCADNGCFTRRAGGFSLWRFLDMLLQPNLKRYADRCLFVAAPDVLTVLADGAVHGDPVATLKRFPMWSDVIRRLGFPVALVAQDGLETTLDAVPWDLVDVLFIGGSTEWKIGRGAHACVQEARRRGKRTHMGRVNSYKRLALANSWGVDTADGTFLKYGPEQNLPRLLRWFERLKEMR